MKLRIASIVSIGFLLACGGAPETVEPEPAPPSTTSPQEGRDGNSPQPDQPSDELSSSEAEEVLRTVYQPIHAFYEGMETGPDGHELPPEGMRSPDALRAELTATMSTDLANEFIDQLLMERDGKWIVRPTEMIVTPYPGGPALQSVDVEQTADGWVITAHYEETELYGALDQEHVVQRDGDSWKLIDIR